MAKRPKASAWARALGRALARQQAGLRRLGRVQRKAAAPPRLKRRGGVSSTVPAKGRAAAKRRTPAAAAASRMPAVLAGAAGSWLAGVAAGPTGARRYRLYRPATPAPPGGRWPLLVMLHGCSQTAEQFALSTRMNRVAAREGFMVLYPEQDRLAHVQGCWNWYELRSGRAFGEAGLIVAAIDQACALHGADRARVAVAGLSAGAGLAGLLATRFPGRFRAVVMHSGVPPGAAESALGALEAMRGRRKPPPPQPPYPLHPAWPPLLVLQGGLDPVVAPSNARAAAELWAAVAGARERAPRTVQRGARHAMQVTDFARGAFLAARLLEVPALGHAWSGGSALQPFGDPLGPDASRLIWSFVARRLG